MPTQVSTARTHPARPGVLVVMAHPDDESLACGGLLARCAAQGARVSLLCLTHGEHGRRGRASDPDRPDLASVRRDELKAAARTLGLEDVTVLDHEDGLLPHVDPTLVERDIDHAIRQRRPAVLITFDADGLYWHPDHIAVHHRVTATVRRLSEGSADGRRAPPPPPALYYVSMPPGAMTELVRHVRAATAEGRVQAPDAWDILGINDASAFGAEAPDPTLVLDVGRFAVDKLAAIRCHRSQVAGGVLDRLADVDGARRLAWEHYRRADIGSGAPTFIDGFAREAPTLDGLVR